MLDEAAPATKTIAQLAKKRRSATGTAVTTASLV